GTCASLASLWWYRHEDIVSAGASGAIFGLYGVYIAILTTRLIPLGQRGPLLRVALTFVGYNIIFGFEPGVDNAAHLGGLFSGLVLGYSLYPILKSSVWSKIMGKVMGMTSLAVLVGSGTLLFANLQAPLNLASDDAFIFYDLVDELFEKESELRTSVRRKDTENMAILLGWKEIESLMSEMQELTLNREDAVYRDELELWVQRVIQHYQRNTKDRS
ncbi:MAG: rhomboid family intramembrane serine protease, partial [Chlamydiia bacterium]|nr:rhomboid family intramembrane serine protease [Chlamydiia bacterium]